MSALLGKTIVLGVTGGIAAYKSCELCSRLKKAGAGVFVIMTRSACEFVAPLTFETLSQNPVVTCTFARPNHHEVEHIALAKAADLFVIAPATANIIAKLALGLADDMLSTTALATRARLLVAPAMNTQMYSAQATQQNLRTLEARSALIIGPEGGLLACGDVGAGRMSEPVEIIAACEAFFASQKDFEGQHAVVTAGPTREMLDPVRFLTNRSSGRMGYAVAQALQERGAKVTLVSGPVSLPVPPGVSPVFVTSTKDLLQALTVLAPQADILIQAAAPADYTMEPEAEKIKKRPGEALLLKLQQTPDVAQEVGRQKKPGQFFVGFAAETGDHPENARQKLEKKRLDLICLNDVTQPGAGFDVDTNVLTLISSGAELKLPRMSKRQAADKLLDEILRLRKATV